MLLSNLSVLLAERNLKITKVSKDTGISRTTLTSLVSNNSKGIQFDTLNELCMYLKAEPKDVFLYIPFNIKLISLNFLDKENFTLVFQIEHHKLWELHLNASAKYSCIFNDPDEILMSADLYVKYDSIVEELGHIPKAFYYNMEETIKTAFLCECYNYFQKFGSDVHISIYWDNQFFK